MRRAVLPIVLALAAVTGCGGGTTTEQPLTVGSFDLIEVRNGVRVDVVQGSRATVTVMAGDKVIDRVVTKVEAGELQVGVRDRGIVIGPDPLGDARVRVSVPALSGLRIAGSGDLDVTGVDADRLAIDINGTGEITAGGRATDLVTTIHGAGDVDLSRLAARTANVEIHGAGHVSLDVSDRLGVEIRGAGDVTYTGDPQVHSDIHVAGDLRRAG